MRDGNKGVRRRQDIKELKKPNGLNTMRFRRSPAS